MVAVAGVTGYLLRPQASAPGTSTAQPGMLPGQTAQPTTSSGQTALPFNGLQGPGGVAVDNAGDVYVADTGNSPLLELAAGSGSPTVLPSTGLSNVTGVAHVYVTDAGNNGVVKLAG